VPVRVTAFALVVGDAVAHVPFDDFGDFDHAR
jgi:hypothetical protein